MTAGPLRYPPLNKRRLGGPYPARSRFPFARFGFLQSIWEIAKTLRSE